MELTPPPLPSLDLEQALRDLVIFATLVFAGGTLAAMSLRRRGLLWTWALPALPLALALWSASAMLGLVLSCGGLYACVLGARWQREDLHHGLDRATAAAAAGRLGMVELLARAARDRLSAPKGWVAEQEL